MAEEKKRGAGSKLSRSEVVTVRFDPKLRYLAELAARKHRRTLSSYIEWAVETSLGSVLLHEGDHYDDKTSVADEAQRLWDVDEAERFVRLAINYPDLLTHDEQERWKMLADSDLLGPAKHRTSNGSIAWNLALLEDTIFPVIRRHWAELIAAYEAGTEPQRKWVDQTAQNVKAGKIYSGYPKKAGSKTEFDDMDDDIPF